MATSVDKPPPLARRHLVLLAVVAAGLAAATAAGMLTRRVDAPTGLLQVNGRIEGDRVTIASKFAGRVIELAAREGDAVSAGQMVARLDDRAVRGPQADLAGLAHHHGRVGACGQGVAPGDERVRDCLRGRSTRPAA